MCYLCMDATPLKLIFFHQNFKDCWVQEVHIHVPLVDPIMPQWLINRVMELNVFSCFEHLSTVPTCTTCITFWMQLL